MQDLMKILTPPLVLGVLGMVLGILIYLVAKYFAVVEDTRLDDIEKMLPRANCGACGFAGCRDLARSMLAGKTNANACKPIQAADRDALNKYLDEMLKSADRPAAPAK